MKGKITVELTTETPDSGSGMPDLGHMAYWLKKELPNLTFTDSNGKERKLSDKFEVVRVSTEAE